MRFFPGLVIASGLLLVPASRADAQVAITFGSPFSGYSGAAYGGYGGYGYGGYGYGGYGSMVGAPWGMTSYSSAYSAYTAPGTTYFNSGYYAPNLMGSAYGYPAYGYPGSGYGYGYGSAPYFGGRSYGYVSTGPYMGLPRPFAGLVRVPR